MFDTPVLFLVFNRPDTTRRVFAAIREVRPKRLFIAADGPRAEVAGEEALCTSLRRELLAAIDWDCQVETLFREKNLGCRPAVNEALNWFFTHVREGIILEDDCLPAADFFPFCSSMLEKYRDSQQVAMVGGTSLLEDRGQTKDSYFFSKHFAIWGWATWQDRWQSLRRDSLVDWLDNKRRGWLKGIFTNRHVVAFYTSVFDKDREGRLDTWDVFWNYSLLLHDKLTITPVVNLVSNIGTSGLHAAVADRRFMNMPTGSFDPVTAAAPLTIAWNKELDAIQYENTGLGRFSWKVSLRSWAKRCGVLIPALWLKKRLRS